ncbi:type II toxin-antitoxin system Phd/YefM family antitoxin [Desulfovibrio sp. OttesenSCG-928-F20]|nr:type II toxin-antitoxin system Phd/YefM family antitoxin [Desulfovibrio sp. OttesenSCG-928-F20]
MITPIHAGQVVSVSELKRNLSAILASASGEPIAVLNHNKPEAYLVPAEYYEQLIERLEDMEDAFVVAQRSRDSAIPVTLAEL